MVLLEFKEKQTGLDFVVVEDVNGSFFIKFIVLRISCSLASLFLKINKLNQKLNSKKKRKVNLH